LVSGALALYIDLRRIRIAGAAAGGKTNE